MPSSYTTSLKLVLPVTGENTNTWGDLVNTDITTLVDQSVAGYLAIAMPDANLTLTSGNGSASNQSRYSYIEFTAGAIAANRSVILPAVSKQYVFKNSTAYYLSIDVTGGPAPIILPPNSIISIVTDGSSVNYAANTFPHLTVDYSQSGGGDQASILVGKYTNLSGGLQIQLVDNYGGWPFGGPIYYGALIFTPSDGAVSPAPLSFGTYGLPAMTINTSQNVLVGTVTTAVTSARLLVDSTTQGFRPPVMTTAEKNAIGSPTDGLIVFDTTLNKLCLYASGAWRVITSTP